MAPAPSLSYAPLPNASVSSYLYLLPATPNAFNVVSLVMYVVCTPGLTYYAYAGGPDIWALGLVFYGMLLGSAWMLNFAGEELLSRDQDMLLPA